MSDKQMATALRRLALDYDELQRDPVPGCAAYPVRDDWLEWHADLRTLEGPLAGVCIHVKLFFPRDYPLNAPKFEFPVAQLPSFRHPNLYGTSFCVDILDGSFGRSYQYGQASGWTPAYTVRGLVQQLSTFIFHRADRGRGSEVHWGWEEARRIAEEAARGTCSCVSVGAPRVCEPAPVQLPAPGRAAAEDAAKGLRLTTSALLQVLSLVDGQALLNFGFVCRTWRAVAVRTQLLARRETVCYVTKLSSVEAVLGIGLRAEWHEDQNLKSATAVLDVLSAEAFDEHHVRRGAYGEAFTHFLPLALEPRHFARALPRVERALADVCRAQAFQPWMALAALPGAMNAFVVSLMGAAETGALQRHASERALWGYASLHHLLLALGERHPSLPRIARRMVQDFVRDPARRHKRHTPDLGQLLVLQSLAPGGGWDALAPALLQEAMARNVMWVQKRLRQRGDRRRASDLSDDEWFRDTLTSQRLLMFQALFLRLLPSTSLPTYTARFGQPTEAAQAALLAGARRILQVSGWPAFLAAFGVPTRPTLRASEQLSDASGYTGAARVRTEGGWAARLKELDMADKRQLASRGDAGARAEVDVWDRAAAARRAAEAERERHAAAERERRAAAEERARAERAAALGARATALVARATAEAESSLGSRQRTAEHLAAAAAQARRREAEAAAREELDEELARAPAPAREEEDGWTASGATRARAQEQTRRRARLREALAAQAAWDAEYGQRADEVRAEWLARLARPRGLRPVLCRFGEACRQGAACRWLHVPPRPVVDAVAARVGKHEEASTAAGDGATEDASTVVAEEASTVADTATVADTSATPAAEDVVEEDTAAAARQVVDRRRRALEKKLREIAALEGRQGLSAEQHQKVARRDALERELAELE